MGFAKIEQNMKGMAPHEIAAMKRKINAEYRKKMREQNDMQLYKEYQIKKKAWESSLTGNCIHKRISHFYENNEGLFMMDKGKIHRKEQEIQEACKNIKNHHLPFANGGC